jgi:NAD(P)-dependent dehydrogenase (short-subunit alcohol dehydrogenase family)
MFLNEHSFSQSAPAVFHVADVSHAQDVDGLTHRIVETYGRLDCAF